MTLKFTLDNTSLTEGASSIFFDDNLEAVLPGLAPSGMLPTMPCGSSSTLTFDGTTLSLAGGEVPADDMCTYSVTLLVPGGTPDGTYPNGTTVNFALIGGTSFFLPPATDELVVNSTLLELTKEFTDDPVLAGDLVTLEFTLKNLDGGNAVSDIAFTDNLNDALSGLSATVFPTPGAACNGSGTLSQTPPGLLGFTGGSLAAGAECTFSATLTVPAGASAGTFTNTTSGVTGTIGGLAVSGDPASDDLQINALTFTKVFVTSPVDPGGTTKLRFTITNLNTTSGVAELSFSDNLDATLSGLVATGLPLSNVCGAGSQIAGTSLLLFTGGNLDPTKSCTFDVDLKVPNTAPPASFNNTTSNLFQAGLPVANPATATLTINPATNVNTKITPVAQFIFFTSPCGGADPPCQFQFELALTNTNGGPIFAPLVTQFISITTDAPGPDVTVNNADFGGTGPGSGYNYSAAIGPDNKLDTGEKSDSKIWIFDDPGKVNFEFTADVFGSLVALPGSFAKTNISQSFLFKVDVKKGTVTIVSIITDVAEPAPVEIQIPTDFALQQNYPNPFNPETSIRFQLPEAADVTLSIYNLRGQLVRKLVNERKQAGFHEVTWNAKDNAGNKLPSGVYLYRIQAGAFTDVKKLTLLR